MMYNKFIDFYKEIILSPFHKNNKIYYGWVIVYISIFITLIISGARFSFGVYFNPLTKEFDLSRTTTSSIQSLYMLMCFMFTFAGGWALDKYGPKFVFLIMGIFAGLSFVLTSFVGSFSQIYFTYSLLLATGTGYFYPVINSTISKWFDKKRGLAMGIATSGSRSGQAIFAPLSAYFISNFGWRIAYLITGLMIWVIVIPLSRLMKKSPQEVGAIPDGYEVKTEIQKKAGKIETAELKGLTFTQALKSSNYWYFVPSWVFVGFANMLIYTHVITYAIDKNIAPISAATIMTIIGVVAIPGGILVGRLVDIMRNKILLMIFSVLLAIAIVSLIWATNLMNFYIIAGILGLCISGIGICCASLAVDAFGKRHIGMIMGSLDSSYAIGATIGPLVGGLFYDIYGSYNLAFLISGIGLIASCLLLIFFKTISKQPGFIPNTEANSG